MVFRNRPRTPRIPDALAGSARVVEALIPLDVAISDRGIPARELRKIFQRFYRTGRDVQRTAVGLGLGLFIVRNLVRRQGGRVVARSQGSGAGSRFVVTLRAAASLAEGA